MKTFRHTLVMKKITAENFTFFALLAVAIGSRLVQHSWNFTAIIASSFVFAFLFKDSKTKAILLPTLAMIISDLFLSLSSFKFFHSTMVFVYLALGLALTPIFLTRNSLDKNFVKIAAVLSGSFIFFIVTNFGVWITEGLYPMTTAGLVQCYTMAIPFFQNQLASDVVLTPVLYFVMKRVLAFDFLQVVVSQRH